MTGADLCVFWRDWTGQVVFTDISVTEGSLVKEDRINQCKGLKWRPKPKIQNSPKKKKNKREKLDSTLEYIYQRKLWPCDEDSYRIEDGTTHIVWAIGRGPLYKLEGLNITSSFNVRTGMSRTRFIDFEVRLGR